VREVEDSLSRIRWVTGKDLDLKKAKIFAKAET
jgi:hypothetical protein